MFRRLLRLIRVMLPAVIVAAAWAGWWLVGDGPIKVSRPDREITGSIMSYGRTTVVETPYGGMPPEKKCYLYWRYLDSGKCIIEPEPLETSNAWLTRDENTLIVAPNKTPIRLYDRETGRVRAELPALGTWQKRRPLFLTPDTKSVIYEAVSGIIVGDVATGRVVHCFPELHGPVGISPDGQFIVAAPDRKTLVLRDLTNGVEVARTSCNDTDELKEPVVGPGGRRILLMTLNANATQFVHDVWSTDPPGREQIDVRPQLYRSAFGGSGRYVETMFKPNFRVWDVAPWPPVEVSAEIGVSMYAPNFSSDGRWVVTTNTTCTEWQLRDPETLSVHHRGPMSNGRDSFNFSPDGRWMIVEEKPIGLRLWINAHTVRISDHPLFPVVTSHIFATASGQSMRIIPNSVVLSFTADGSAVWVMPNNGNNLDGIYELWSLTPPRLPWWLWTLSIIGVGGLILNIRRRTYSSAKRR